MALLHLISRRAEEGHVIIYLYNALDIIHKNDNVQLYIIVIILYRWDGFATDRTLQSQPHPAL